MFILLSGFCLPLEDRPLRHGLIVSGAKMLVTAVTLLCAGFILKWAWFSDTPPDVIYYPPLDQELRDKEREARGLC